MHPGWRCARVLRPPEADPSAPGATAGRRRTAAAHAFPTDAAPGARGPELRGRCLLGWFQFHNTILNVWTAILKLPEVAHEQPWWKDEKERFIYSFISSFIIGEKPRFEDRLEEWERQARRLRKCLFATSTLFGKDQPQGSFPVMPTVCSTTSHTYRVNFGYFAIFHGSLSPSSSPTETLRINPSVPQRVNNKTALPFLYIININM